MNKIKLKIFGTIIAFILTFIIHNLYLYYPNIITSIISPVNESIWEHMKVLFTSILISGIIQKIIVKTKKLKIENICISNFIGALLSIPIFLIVFIPIYNIIGKNFIITIILMLITIIISEYISYIFINKKNLNLENYTILLAIITYIIFLILTLYPPKIKLFIDPINNTYGINKNLTNKNN